MTPVDPFQGKGYTKAEKQGGVGCFAILAFIVAAPLSLALSVFVHWVAGAGLMVGVAIVVCWASSKANADAPEGVSDSGVSGPDRTDG